MGAQRKLLRGVAWPYKCSTGPHLQDRLDLLLGQARRGGWRRCRQRVFVPVGVQEGVVQQLLQRDARLGVAVQATARRGQGVGLGVSDCMERGVRAVGRGMVAFCFGLLASCTVWSRSSCPSSMPIAGVTRGLQAYPIICCCASTAGGYATTMPCYSAAPAAFPSLSSHLRITSTASGSPHSGMGTWYAGLQMAFILGMNGRSAKGVRP